MYKLIVKNFGPLKDIDIELNKMNLFIGENGSGKSVLGKLITIVSDINYFSYGEEDDIFPIEVFISKIENFNINYLNDNTYIKYYDINNEDYKFYLNNNFIRIINHIPDMILTEKEKNLKSALNLLDNLDDLVKNTKYEDIIKNLFNKLDTLSARYIPSERNLVAIISKSLSSLIAADILLPKFIIEFISDFEKATNKLKELNVLNVKYNYGDGTNRHKIYFDDNNYLPLNESSSGIQAVVPLLITYKYFTQKYHTIVIEEPEQNLFPKAQKETVEFIIENFNENNQLFIMTHSPYILTALNNLILANDVKLEKGEEAIQGIVKTSQCIPFENINAYYIKDGKAKNIMDKDNRLIGINAIDEISDEVNETFDELLSKLDNISDNKQELIDNILLKLD